MTDVRAETDGWDAYLTACEKYRGSTFFYQPTLQSENRDRLRAMPSREEEKTAKRAYLSKRFIPDEMKWNLLSHGLKPAIS
jgi:hypothetical protein